MSSKKRKQIDGDVEKSRSRSSSPQKKSKTESVESMSIEESNKLRASLGLAPLQIDEPNKGETLADDGSGEKIYNEDGFEFRHRKPANWAEMKREQELKEKLEIAKKKRDVYSKVLKSKGLADADSDDDESTQNWVQKLRRKEEDEKKAAERAKLFDEFENEILEKEKSKKKNGHKNRKSSHCPTTAGLVVGHSLDAFTEGHQILVLEDKGVLDEGDEVLMNPNLVENERHSRNVELRKRKDHYKGFDDNSDKAGVILAKYDEELEGAQKQQFRLDDKGGMDVSEELREKEALKKMQMAGKRLESLESVGALKLATEFYTHDEMVEFRKIKKRKSAKARTRRTLKAADLEPIERADERKDFGRRRSRDDENIKEESENGPVVDLARLQKLKDEALADNDDDSDDDLLPTGGIDIAGVVIDDDAEDELNAVLARTRKLKEAEHVGHRDVGAKVKALMACHETTPSESIDNEKKICFDATVEYCRQIGKSGILEDDAQMKNEEMQELEQDDDGFQREQRIKIDNEIIEKEKRKRADSCGWMAGGRPISTTLDSDDEEALKEAENQKWYENDDDDEDYEPALGEEVDVSKGVGAMLKLAAQKGYLDDSGRRRANGPSLDHLRSKHRTQIDPTKHDIEDKYMKKLDRLGTTGKGPLQPFVEKTEYHPDVNITYTDKKGRDMDAKDAYRELSYKFHGRTPGKKQLEKRANRKDIKERMLKTNSYDTPLGTLSKQLKKQKQLATPYLVLSGATDQ
ncbi:unnamed protein product [Caenorhabditis bovis]|uniref:U4/U6.U5 tri-snRNP-associated protein 1 n=1 Tax=Caenorhabditis bovis TaxID=2654633 RepID=A0A8S1EDP0_9PELO|nr:unnamed protein product [Caenorhabditis bovis]